ncbi:MAG: c-type cytochrome [Akkermansiaceae bacterium]|jgi:putative membrane-bound dehydrogenase-like protein|nr:c-type cytochrome [Akkermansiaceae bacterium]MDP4647361.1 c-type cytochrome [Akkermansiaceae bacterium]MDP4720951.1 c-type cytochrome [Akkermansiaceae bacterium]MDP4779513.1 c-type cytochrome [Akkermansiaceae bacterium]MDP4847331.1 c-type cytochrome [Akkermansiaceae bacterium]
MKTLIPLVLIPIAATGWTPSDTGFMAPLDTFVVKEGLEVTEWAVSPMLRNPTNMDIDHLGRIWVTEGVNYRMRGDQRQPEGDRIVILEDTDKDGKADKSSVFWQDPELVTPLGIAVFDNVVMVAQPPHMLKLTDTNRDGKFSEKDGDVREVFLTGFNGRNHDHSLHSVTSGPDGKWVFNQGNCGAMFEDKSGTTIKLGGAYIDERYSKNVANVKEIAGQPSGDGFSYNSGAAIRLNPDGTGAKVIGHGFRNSYEQITNSYGFVFQNDNDDPPACRVTHMLEGGNAGFFSRDGKRTWRADQRPGQDTPTAEWRQDDPGTMPAGDVYGGGSPTGVSFYENGALGEEFVGTLLACEPGQNLIFSYQPELEGAGMKLVRDVFVTTNPANDFAGSDFTGQGRAAAGTALMHNFRPSDATVGADGAIYVADWTDSRVGGHGTNDQGATGVIYRIAPKGFKPVVPEMDLTTIEGAVTALKSPANNVRWLGFEKLKSEGEGAFDAVAEVMKDANPFVAARGIWLLPYMGEEGIQVLEGLLTHDDEKIRLAAFRAIRRSDGVVDAFSYAKQLANDESPAVRAEAAIEMRYRSYDEAQEVLLAVAKGYDGKDRSYLESLGLGAGKNTEALWQTLSTEMKPGASEEWSEAFARLTWRLMPEAAVPALAERAASEKLSNEARILALDSLAFINTRASADALISIALEDSPVKDTASWWLQNREGGEWAFMKLGAELKEKGILKAPVKIQAITMPTKPEKTNYSVKDVLALKGDATKGKALAARCVMCHQVDGQGAEYGPALKGFGKNQTDEVLIQSLIDPSAEISHGFDGRELILKDGGAIHGLVIGDGKTVTIKSTGGVTQQVPKNKIKANKPLEQSLMLSSDQLGLSAQDTADIVEWLKGY